MIIAGDLAVPLKENVRQLADVFNSNPKIFKGKLLICNFEGLINSNDKINSNEPVLYNNNEVIKILKRRGSVAVCLANNHILDLPAEFETTINLFKETGIYYLGAGFSKDEADSSISIKDDNNDIIIFNSCWRFLLYNHHNPSESVYISVIDEFRLLEAVRNKRLKEPKSQIIVYLHWNFDLEILPFPMHRVFAKKLIDFGANLVIGSHSHCFQGGEKYSDGYIIYGLGNFFIPHGEFADGKINYPDFSRLELVLERETVKDELYCHWFNYSNENNFHTLEYIKSEDFQNSEILMQYSPFNGMDDIEYLKYFKRNRRKKILIPVFKNFNYRFVNRLNETYLVNRARIARNLAKLNIIKWQN